MRPDTTKSDVCANACHDIDEILHLCEQSYGEVDYYCDDEESRHALDVLQAVPDDDVFKPYVFQHLLEQARDFL